MNMRWIKAPDIQTRTKKLLRSGAFPHVKGDKITAVRGYGSTSRATARIWSLPRLWQETLNIEPQYIIEVICPRFEKLPPAEQEKTLVHELMHIPKSFSGALVSHRGRYHRINKKTAEVIYEKIRKGL